MNLKEKYKKEVIPKMMEKFGYKNKMAVPKIDKVVLNVGIGRIRKEDKKVDEVFNTLQQISGQKPVFTLARKAVSAFKIRKGMKIGIKVTLRGDKMWDFLTKLIYVALPRIRNFSGLNPNMIDNTGNLTIGFQEQLVFPEIDPGKVNFIHGLEVTISTTTKSREKGLNLLKFLGFPIKNK